MKNNKITSGLKEFYKEDFTILNESGGWLSKKIHFEACPNDHLDVKFTGTYIKKTKKIVDYYRSEMLTYYGSDWLNESLGGSYSMSVGRLEVACYSKSGKVPSFEKVIKEESQELGLISRIYLFESISRENSKETLEGIINLCRVFLDKGIDDLAFDVTFFDGTTFEKEEIDQYHFGFNNLKDGDFEYSHFFKKRNNRLTFKIKKDSSLPTASQLYDILLEDINRVKYHIL